MADDKKAQYAKPASQVDLEERLANGNRSFRELSTSDTFTGAEDDGKGRDYRVKGNDTSAYVGTDPMYQNYANKTEKPGASPEESVEGQIFAEFDEALHREPVAKDDDEDVEEGEAGKAESSPGAAGSSPTQTSGS